MRINLTQLQEQHSALALVSTQLSSLLLDKKNFTALESRSLLDSLTDELTAHLFTEDKLLYPYLNRSSDPDIVKISKDFYLSMGSLKEVYEKFISKWTEEEITKMPKEFIKEAQILIKALHERINKEERDLFPLIN